ncbi:MAG: tetratricopeptide repeat protein [Candidatus Riflebacteria bacterium]|nr:tetratricopeptide repeat protein [Candidatus Riflebacteria bacterium]
MKSESRKTAIPLKCGIIFLFLLSELNCSFAQNDTSFTFVKPTGTIQELLAAPQSKPKANTYYLLALSQAQKGNNRLALTTVERGLQIEPENISLLKLRGGIFARTGNEAEAVKDFQKVIELDPYDDYAVKSLKLLQPKIAYTAPRVIPPKQSSESPVSTPEGQNSSVKKDTPEKKILESSYFETIRIKQKCFFGLSALKRAYESLVQEKPDEKGKLNINTMIEKKYLSASPICPEAGELSIQGDVPACSKHGSFNTLESEVTMVFSDFNKGMQAKFGRVLVEAQKSFEQVIVQYPKWAEARYQLADTYFRQGMDENAILEVRKCLDIDPKNIDAKMLLANLYFKTGKKEAALNILEQVQKSNGDNVYGLSARSLTSAIKSGRLYYQIFPPY